MQLSEFDQPRPTLGVYSLEKLLAQARKLAVEYRKVTGQPLTITAELARQDAARLMDLELSPQGASYDAIGRSPPREGRRVQIKGRAILDEEKGGQRIGQLKLEQAWDSVMLVLMDEEFEPTEIWEAMREELEETLANANSKRSKRGAMSVAKFKVLGQLVWTREEGTVEDEVWENHP